MSYNTPQSFEGTASFDLNQLAAELVREFGNESAGEHVYASAPCGESVWLRFDEHGLLYLTTDITAIEDPMRTILSLERTPHGYVARTLLGPLEPDQEQTMDSQAKDFRVGETELLSYEQMERLRDIFDEVDERIDIRLEPETREFNPDEVAEPAASPEKAWVTRLRRGQWAAQVTLANMGLRFQVL